MGNNSYSLIFFSVNDCLFLETIFDPHSLQHDAISSWPLAVPGRLRSAQTRASNGSSCPGLLPSEAVLSFHQASVRAAEPRGSTEDEAVSGEEFSLKH